MELTYMFHKIFSVLLVLLTINSARAADTPNFVFLLADDVSWDDLACYGHPTIKTPNIDRLAASGLRFTNAYLTTSSCSPSRCSIITGRYPHNTGAPELHTSLPDGQVLFPQLLRDAGYYTVISGKHHMGGNANPAFEKISKGKGPGKEGDWVQLLKDRPKDRPFFCWYASTDAHRDWSINDEAPRYDPNDVVVPPYLVDGPKTRQDLTGYYHEVSRFDHFVGEVVEELRRQSVLDNTLIIVMADNGRPMPRCKTRLYDSGIKTPFVVYQPKFKSAVVDSLVSVIDIGPTLLELAGVKIDRRIQGVSFAPVLTDPEAVTRDVVFAEHNWHVYKSHERLVRTGNWLYIRNNFPGQQNLCVEAYGGGAGRELWAVHKAGKLTEAQKNVFRNPCPPEELYHVSSDPDQLNNLAAESDHEPILRRMRAVLARWSKETGDTIPRNPTPDRDAPPGSPPKSRKGFKHGEMPGDATAAQKIIFPGPVRINVGSQR
jgi:arylsulfatase